MKRILLLKMDKKELKKFINENGFFVHLDTIEAISADSLETNAPHKKKMNSSLPSGENIGVFRGLASQRFGKGEKSRNGYKIIPEAWDFSDYSNNPVFLLQHNAENPIGKTLSARVTEAGLEIEYYIDFNAMDDKDAHRIKSGLINGISTGHITREEKIEDNKTGSLMSIEEWINSAKPDFDDYISLMNGENENYTLTVTKAEAVEISQVSIPSNPKALTMQNSLQSYFSNTMITQEKFQELKKNAVEGAEVETPQEVPETTPETVEVAPVEPETTPEAVAPETTEEVKTEENSIKKFSESFQSELKQNKDLIAGLGELVLSLSAQVESLQNTIDSIPARKVLATAITKEEFAKQNSGKAIEQILRKLR